LSAEAIIALEAILRFLRNGHVDEAESYADTVLAALRTLPPPAPSSPPSPASPDVNGSGADRARALAAKRSRDYRAKQRANAGSASNSVTRHVTERDVTRDASVTERDASRSRSLSQISLSKEIMGDLERGVTPAARDASRSDRDGKRDGSSVTRRLPERPPPSDTPKDEVERWCVSRGLDPAHASMGRFLDVFRNAKPKLDWPACFRNFLEREAAGFDAPSGVRRATGVQHDPPGASRAWKVGR
jgi:hypothetical protein